tara:strand:- start:2161 stop:2352 length:192 start_codon:yes stop_codon:yes gene_type:complete
MSEEHTELPNQIDIEINDNTTSFNHNVAIRITDASREISIEELSKLAMDRIIEARRMVKNGSK